MTDNPQCQDLRAERRQTNDGRDFVLACEDVLERMRQLARSVGERVQRVMDRPEAEESAVADRAISTSAK